MRRGACTPEELETLFEDSFVTHDGQALAQLFEAGAVLLAENDPREARGGAEIAQLATAMWERGDTYLADPRRVVQARDTALVVAHRAINVVRRGDDGSWRYAIALMSFDPTTERRSNEPAQGT
jgi:hypothetical protein